MQWTVENTATCTFPTTAQLSTSINWLLRQKCTLWEVSFIWSVAYYYVRAVIFSLLILQRPILACNIGAQNESWVLNSHTACWVITHTWLGNVNANWLNDELAGHWKQSQGICSHFNKQCPNSVVVSMGGTMIHLFGGGTSHPTGQPLLTSHRGTHFKIQWMN